MAVEVETLKEKLSMIETKAFLDTRAYRAKHVDVQALFYILAKVDAKTLIYALADRLPLVEEEKVDNMPANVECKALLKTLAAKEKELKVQLLGDALFELKGMKTLNALTETVAQNEV